MASISVTAANVAIVGSSSTAILVQAGESLTQGQPVYRSTTTGKYLKADANDTEAKAEAAGIVLTPAASDGWFLMVTEGQINPGATLTKGTAYYVANVVGEIAPFGDLTTNDYVTLLGHASSTSVLDLAITPTRIQKA